MVINQLCMIETVLITGCFLLLIIHKSAYADPVLITDDASVADLYTCHFESNINFYKHQEVNSSFSPVCGIAKNLELSFQLDDHVQNKNRHDVISGQFKRNLKAVESNSWGAAASLTISRNMYGDDHSSWKVNLPVTYLLLDDRLFLNGNISYEHQGNTQYVLAAISSNYWINVKTSLSAEIFNQDHQSVFFQTAFGYELIQDFVRVQVAYADRFDHHHDRWFGLGAEFLTNFKLIKKSSNSIPVQ